MVSAQILKSTLLTTRPSFLVLAPVCVFLGLSLSPSIDIGLTFMIVIGAVCAHISVNMLNEYFDFKSGLDLNTVKTKFSGGSGALPDHPEAAPLVLVLGILSLCITMIIGVYLLLNHSSTIMPIGLVGIALVVTYTQWLNRIPLLCLIAPGLGFGVLMVVGAYVVVSGSHAESVWLISLIPFFVINNLLLLNQYPDIAADASSGRRTFPIIYGTVISNIVYGLFALSCYALIVLYIYLGMIPILSLVALLPMAGAIYALLGAIKHQGNIGSHPQYLAANVAAAVLTPFFLAIAITCG